MPSPLSRLARILLILHGFVNLAQGLYTIFFPREWAQLSGDMFVGAPDKALQSISLGAIGVGWIELVFSYQGNRALMIATIPMRLGFAAVMAKWGSMGVMGYEVGVAVVCGVAAFA